MLQDNNLNIPAPDTLPNSNDILPYVFVADEAYPLLPNMMRPYQKSLLNDESEYFNARLSRARKCVECTFGIINSKWWILWKALEIKAENTDSIVKTICLLHNIIIDKENTLNLIEDIPLLQTKDVGTRNYFNRPSLTALNTRDAFKNYFSNNIII